MSEDAVSSAPAFAAPPEGAVDAFIARWRPAGGSERANYQLFLSELCDLIGVDKPGVATAETRGDPYCFERPVAMRRPGASPTTNFIDLYKKDCFVCEAKQGSDRKPKGYGGQETALGLAPEAGIRTGTAIRGTPGWAKAMEKAKNQADRYARALNDEGEGWPPFLIVTDVGFTIELWADFTRSGRSYQQFPNASRFRIELEHLRDPDVRALLAAVWTDPMALDPAAKSAEVTREIAQRLAAVAQLMEMPVARGGGGLDPRTVSEFLMRCLFTMFAEDVGLLPEKSFQKLLSDHRDNPTAFKGMVRGLWESMNSGGFCPAIAEDVRRFNGGLFKDTHVPDMAPHWIDQLIQAADRDWKHVEPAIFGTLLERALDPKERHKLGAHYTPRAYVERLVIPTVMQPLQADWEAAKAAAMQAHDRGDTAAAVEIVKGFHRELCEVRVLDPACGTGNFLYVTLELMKRLEGEVLDLLETLGANQYLLDLAGHTVDPHQFLGIELNARAVAIAELVVWIGYLQWHIRNRGRVQVPEPVLRDFRNIRRGDAILAHDPPVLRRDETGAIVSQWDGETVKPHPVTGDPVPDETAQLEIYDYPGAKPAPDWPAADFIVGNPPFIGGSRVRSELGTGYAEALWKAYPKLPNSIDLVMYWWDRAATLVRTGKAKRFGFITTNSITQTFNGRVVTAHLEDKKPLSLLFAIPDHPWFKALDRTSMKHAAAVRVAMSVGVAGSRTGRVGTVVSERPGETDSADVALAWSVGKIHAGLKIGPNVKAAKTLKANSLIAHTGVKLHGAGFIVTPDEARTLGLGTVPGLEDHIKPFRNGRDLAAKPRGVMVIDLHGLTENQVRAHFPAVYQWVRDRVKPERDAKVGQSRDMGEYAARWWEFGKPRTEMRSALAGLPHFFATTRTGSHKAFQRLNARVTVESEVVCIASQELWVFSVLNANVHQVWAMYAGSKMGVGNHLRYNHSHCFDKFPFPDLTATQRAHLAELGERLDKVRKDQLAAHDHLTLTGLYNVLEKVRAETPLSDEDRRVYDDGLVGVLNEIHEAIDVAVLDAYGWPRQASEEEIVARVLALNHARAAEEAEGRIRWLRPAFQDPNHGQEPVRQATQTSIEGMEPVAVPIADKRPWPKDERGRIKAVRALVDAAPLSAEAVAAHFTRARRKDVAATLDLLVDLGLVEATPDGFTATPMERAA